MSFKKMRLVSDDNEIMHTTTNAQPDFSKYQIPVQLRRISDLDSEINQILKSPINERQKSKLYSQALRKFLIHKKLHQEEQEAQFAKTADIFKKLNSPIVQTKSSKKIPKVPHKAKTKKKKKPRKQILKIQSQSFNPRIPSTSQQSTSTQSTAKKYKDVNVGTRVVGARGMSKGDMNLLRQNIQTLRDQNLLTLPQNDDSSDEDYQEAGVGDWNQY